MENKCFCGRDSFEEGNRCIFHCEKDDWYLIEDDEKVWDEKLLRRFWRNFFDINQKYEDYFDFSRFIFPEFSISDPGFSNNFEIIDREFEKHVDFSDCKFLGSVSFENPRFLEKVIFKNSVFEEEVYFFDAHFYKDVDFENVNFKGKLHFLESLFLSKAIFDDANFSDIHENIFASINIKSRASLQAKKHLNENKISKSDQSLIPKMSFENVNFNPNFLFQNCNLSRTKFFNSRNLDDVIFDNCSFKKDKKSKPKILEYSEFNENERLYRDIKNSFIKNGNLSLAKAFRIRELDIKRMRIKEEIEEKKEKKFFSKKYLHKKYLDLSKLISQYNENFALAFFWMVLAFSVIFLLIWYLSGMPIKDALTENLKVITFQSSENTVFSSLAFVVLLLLQRLLLILILPFFLISLFRKLK